jgi:N-acetylneuraminic acid mutarotase
MHGTTVANDTGNFGMRGVPSLTNNPPALYESADWTDTFGNFWLFGGMNFGEYSALWKYEPTINTWTWMKGPSSKGNPGIYGIKGVCDTLNNPGARGWGALSWTDYQNNLWLFGGYKSGYGILSDLWKYNISTNCWTWMSGTDTVLSQGRFGTKGVPSINNLPPCRNETSASWLDNSGNLWMFGGLGWQPGVGYRYLNDLWKYDISSNMWTWISGDSTYNSPGNYGTKGIPSIINLPSSRGSYSHWKDLDGNFWLFGGMNYDGLFKNDLWKYDLSSNMWTWINGSNISSNGGNTGLFCINNSTNCPSSRLESKACWTDSDNNFWLFGGATSVSSINSWLNDLWHYNVQENEWTLINTGGGPSFRQGSMSFKDTNGEFWLFGGAKQGSYYYNDLWHYIRDTSCAALATFVSSSEQSCENQDCILVSPNPSNGIFNLQTNGKLNEFNVVISDVLGRKVLSKPFSNSSTIELDISDEENGFYYILVNSNGRQFSRKILLIK